MEYQISDVFLKAARHIQFEPVWGGSEDSAHRCERPVSSPSHVLRARTPCPSSSMRLPIPPRTRGSRPLWQLEPSGARARDCCSASRSESATRTPTYFPSACSPSLDG